MNIEHISTLPVLRELYEKPRTLARFNWYVEQMTGVNEQGKLDVVMPITAANPMGREHCLTAVNALIVIDADGVAAAAAQEAAARLAHIDLSARAYVCLVDDVGGAWSNRYAVEAGLYLSGALGQRANKHRHFIGVFCWASEAYTPERVRQEMLASVYRFVYMEFHGLPKTLQQMMQMDGRSRAFAGMKEPVLSEDDLAYTREVLEPYRQVSDAPLTFACLFGDEAARTMGYAPVGLSPYAGFALGLDEALRETAKPEDYLHSGF